MARSAAAIMLAALLFAGFRPIGPLPPLGLFPDPANGAMSVPPVALYLLTFLFPALLAWNAATLASVLRRR